MTETLYTIAVTAYGEPQPGLTYGPASYEIMADLADMLNETAQRHGAALEYKAVPFEVSK
jgi:hypothetical protein